MRAGKAKACSLSPLGPALQDFSFFNSQSFEVGRPRCIGFLLVIRSLDRRVRAFRLCDDATSVSISNVEEPSRLDVSLIREE
jgi:hypothetical protein